MSEQLPPPGALAPQLGSPAVNAELAFWSDVECDDEKHMAIALYLLQKAIGLRENEESTWPTIHQCLRDAAAHCEAARLHFTPEAVEHCYELHDRIFGSEPENSVFSNPESDK